MLGQYVSLSGDLETGRQLLFEAAAVLLKKFGPRHPETQMVIEALSTANALQNNAPDLG